MLLIVLGSGVLHATWNAITKASKDRLVVMAGIGAALTLVGAVVLPFSGMPAQKAIVFAVVSAAIHVAYDFLLINAYRLGDFNQMYPVARGTSPLVVTLGAFIFVNEVPSPLELAGVVVLAVGLMSLAFSAGIRRSEIGALGAAVATGLTIACFSLIDGVGVRRSGNPLAYAAFLFVMEGVAIVVATAIARR
ncbi:MAG: EamA family transporter, partial [Acidimicrobiales bacterium]